MSLSHSGGNGGLRVRAAVCCRGNRSLTYASAVFGLRQSAPWPKRTICCWPTRDFPIPAIQPPPTLADNCAIPRYSCHGPVHQRVAPFIFHSMRSDRLRAALERHPFISGWLRHRDSGLFARVRCLLDFEGVATSGLLPMSVTSPRL